MVFCEDSIFFRKAEMVKYVFHLHLNVLNVELRSVLGFVKDQCSAFDVYIDLSAFFECVSNLFSDLFEIS